MAVYEGLRKRRSYYQLNKELPASGGTVRALIEETTELVPDAFSMRSARVAVMLGEKQGELWDRIYEAFESEVPREKIDGFKAAAGTVLYFYDENTVKSLQEKFPLYAGNFPVWVNQANGMLQINIWNGLRELGIGANLQHYNPVIDETMRKLFSLPKNWKLLAEMPFGGVVEEREPKTKEKIEEGVRFYR